jgi:hypothetical protein
MLRRVLLAMGGGALLLIPVSAALSLSVHFKNPYELKHPVPTQAGQVVRTNKADLDILDMPLGIVFINEDEMPAVEGPLPAYRAHQLAEQKYPDADPSVFIEGTADYDYALHSWVDIYRLHYQLSQMKEGNFVPIN